MSLAAELGLAVLLAMAVSLAACALAVHARVLDAPGGLVRKGDRPPVPTSGGIGIGIGVFAGVGFLAAAGPFWGQELSPSAPQWIAASLVVAVCALAIGLMDDIATFGPRLKAVVFVALSFAAPLAIGPVEALPLAFGVSVPVGFILGLIGSALWMFTIMNTVNFIDGANGLAMGSTAIGLMALAIAAFASGAPAAAGLCLCAAAALVGFLVWNYPAGRLFAGDTGALFIGTLVGAVSLVAVQEGGLSPFVPPIVFFPMLADVLLTLAWRVRHRTKVLEGHRDHFYQIAIRAGMAPWKVTLVYWALMAKCGLIGIALTLTPQTPPMDAAAAVADAPLWTQTLVISTAALASTTTLAAFVVLAGVWLKASAKIRAFAKSRGLDVE